MAKRRTDSPSVLPTRQIEQEPIEHLLLDSRNPRYADDAVEYNQENLVRILWNDFAVDEVALSIAANGYFQEEPLLVVPSERETKKVQYIVVEGNRRLAAVLLLRDNDLRQRIRATNLPEINASAKEKLGVLPVSKYADRNDIWRYIGFRHINGPQPWDSFSKAMYVASVRDEQGVDLDEIADSIGDRHSTVRRLYRGFKVLQQAESMTSFRRDDRVASKFYFSHLYTAMDQIEFQNFLGIDPDSSLRANPVRKSKLADLRELMIWFYGSKSEKRSPIVQRQNPDLNTLRQVISEPRGIEALRAGYPLQRSYEISLGDELRFRNALVRAKEELQVADGTLTTGYSGEEEAYVLFKDIYAIVGSIKERMEGRRLRDSAKTRRG